MMLSEDRRLFSVVFLLSALASGFLMILPNVWQRTDPVYPFQGIEMMAIDSVPYYATRIKEVQRGRLTTSNPYLAQKDLPFVLWPVPEWIQGGIGMLFGLDPPRTVLLVEFTFGCLIFVMITCFGITLTHRRWWALVAAAATVFARSAFSDPGQPLRVLHGLPSMTGFLSYARLTNPQFSSTILFLTLILLLRWYDRPTMPRLAMTAVFAALSIYSYPYVWTFLAVFCGLLFLWHCARREWTVVQGFCAMGVIVAVLALPYALHQRTLSHDPLYTELLARFGLVHTHERAFGVFMFASLILALLPGWISGKRRPIAVAIALAAILAINQQVITGTMLQPHHYQWVIIQPMTVLFFILCLGPLLQRVLPVFSLSVRRLACIILLCLAVTYGAIMQRDSYLAHRAESGTIQEAAGLFRFLRTQPPGTVSTASHLLRSILPLYTPNDVYSAVNANLCLCSNTEMAERFFFDAWMRDLSPQGDEDTFLAGYAGTVYGIYYQELTGPHRFLPAAPAQQAIEDYAAYLQLPDDRKLALHPLRYIVTAAGEEPPVAVQQRSAKIYDDDAYAVWALRNPT